MFSSGCSISETYTWPIVHTPSAVLFPAAYLIIPLIIHLIIQDHRVHWLNVEHARQHDLYPTKNTLFSLSVEVHAIMPGIHALCSASFNSRALQVLKPKGSSLGLVTLNCTPLLLARDCSSGLALTAASIPS